MGKDGISRLGTVSFENLLDQAGACAAALLDHCCCRVLSCAELELCLQGPEQACPRSSPPSQMVLALARSRLPKLSVLLRLRSKRLRRRPPGQLFRPLEDIPAEALQVVRR